MIKLAEVMMITLFTTCGFASCNDKLLDLASDGFRTKILSGVSIPKSMIQEKLGFLYSIDEIEEQYKHAANFNSLYEKSISSENATSEFLAFSQNCYDLYENSALGLREKAAIHMLFEKVADKYLAILKKSKKHQASMQSSGEGEENHRWGGSSYGDADRFFDQFSSSIITH